MHPYLRIQVLLAAVMIIVALVAGGPLVQRALRRLPGLPGERRAPRLQHRMEPPGREEHTRGAAPMTLRTKILGGLGAAALVAGTWGGVSSATRRPGEFCFNYVTTPGEQLPSSVLGPDSPVHDTQIGPNLWRRCGAHAPKD